MDSQTQTQGAQLSKSQIRDALRAKGWEKRWMFSATAVDLPDQKDRVHASLGYVLRTLSRGQLPDPELVNDALTGKKPVPACGQLGCTWDAEHVH